MRERERETETETDGRMGRMRERGIERVIEEGRDREIYRGGRRGGRE